MWPLYMCHPQCSRVAAPNMETPIPLYHSYLLHVSGVPFLDTLYVRYMGADMRAVSYMDRARVPQGSAHKPQYDQEDVGRRGMLRTIALHPQTGIRLCCFGNAYVPTTGDGDAQGYPIPRETFTSIRFRSHFVISNCFFPVGVYIYICKKSTPTG